MGTALPYRRLRHGPPLRPPTPHFLRPRRSVPAPLTWFARSFGFLALAGLIGAAAIVVPWGAAPAALTGHARVVDGDTLRLNGARIRLLGIDAPELHQSCHDAAGRKWPCGRAAKARMAALVSAGPIACAPHGHGYYGRTLARCSVNGIDLGGAMVREGYAVDTGGYLLAEAAARLRQRGLWAGDFEWPRDWRRRHPWH